jgi:hypothetical protein
METSASSGRTKQLFHRKPIATIDAIEHVLNVANSYLTYRNVFERVNRLDGYSMKEIRNVYCPLDTLLKFPYKKTASIIGCKLVTVYSTKDNDDDE